MSRQVVDFGALALHLAAMAVPALVFVHLQLMPGDVVLQTHALKSKIDQIGDGAEDEVVKLEPVAWTFEAELPSGLCKLLAWYRRHAGRAIRLQTSMRETAESMVGQNMGRLGS